MKIALHDNDETGFPNLAIMKLSAWFRRRGNDVVWFNPILSANDIDQVYSSKVFTYTPVDQFLPMNAIRGGSGADLKTELLDEQEHECPDYSLYPIDYSLGFLTRGCPFKCTWCVVPEKEGQLREHADIEEFLRHDKVVLLDNNILPHPHGKAQIEKMIKIGVKVDFNQGLDAGFIDDSMARLLSRLKWLKPLRLACDSPSDMEKVEQAVRHLRWHNIKPTRLFCYMLVRDVDEALERAKFLKGLDLDPFAQPYRDRKGTKPTNEQKALARWINHKAIFKSIPWEEYKRKK